VLLARIVYVLRVFAVVNESRKCSEQVAAASEDHESTATVWFQREPLVYRRQALHAAASAFFCGSPPASQLVHNVAPAASAALSAETNLRERCTVDYAYNLAAELFVPLQHQPR
jgi:hypothetical protein